MVKKIEITNFKSHSNTVLELSNINIMTGLNGMGKSSVIQALLLLRQTHSKGLLEKGLDLNGELCSIGTANDCIYQFASTDDVKFTIETDTAISKWAFKSDLNNLSDTFIKILNNTNSKIKVLDDTSDIRFEFLLDNNYFLFNKGFQYISAFRNGPVNNYDKDTSSVELLSQISRKEGRCELVAHFLHYYKESKLLDSVLLPNTENTLIAQVEAWMKLISPDINISVQPNDDSFKINYSFERGEGWAKTNEFKASNIGFGVSYVLPIVVASLQANIAKMDGHSKFIIIENPEAHIHPQGQSRLVELIARASKNGVQFLIETHSDHIVNGLMVAMKKEVLFPEESKIYYFDRNVENHSTIANQLTILKGGKIKNAPIGFFDQLDKDMKTLLGF